MHLPTPNRAFILRHKWLIEGFAAIPVLLTSIIGAWKVNAELESANSRLLSSDGGAVSFAGFWWIFAGALITVCIGVLRALAARAENTKANGKECPEDLRGCCEMMLRMIRHSFPTHDDETVRVTVYRVCKRDKKGGPEKLEQLIPYATGRPKPSNHIGRTFPAACGIIGKATRANEPLTARRVSKDGAAFRVEMVKDWGYTEQQAKDLDDSRWSWMAVPLCTKQNGVEGVVYLDSCDADYFESEDRRDAIFRGVEALNRYALERYP